jgi:hypothetical protein
MARTLRSKRLRALLWHATGGKCAICGSDLDERTFQADHIIPWKTSRRTNVHEMQAVCPKCNQQKGGTEKRMTSQDAINLNGYYPGQRESHMKVMNILRDWVEGRWDRAEAGGVLPCGYGKSLLIHGIAIDARAQGLAACTLVLNDTEYLRDQMLDKDKVADTMRILDARPFVLRALERQGVRYNANGETLLSTTVQLVKEQLSSFTDWIESVRHLTGLTILIIADEAEVHARGNEWGKTLEALKRAGAFIISLTATPVREDGDEPVGFRSVVVDRRPVQRVSTRPAADPGNIILRHWAGERVYREIIPDFGWSWSKAWQEDPSPICHLSIDTVEVDLSLIDSDGRPVGQSMLHELSFADAQAVLGKVVRDARVIRESVKLFLERLRQLRTMGPDYRDLAGLVLSEDDRAGTSRPNDHAETIKAEIARQAPSLRVLIATTAEDGTADVKGKKILEAFAAGDGDVVIVKRMAGKGVDVKRIKNVLNLSTTRSMRALIQAWSRGNRPYKNLRVGWVTSPKDPRTLWVWDQFITAEGGQAQGDVLELVSEEEVTRNQETKPYHVIAGARAADMGDTKDQWEKEFIRAARDLIDAMPVILQTMTLPDVIRAARDLVMERGWTVPPDETPALDAAAKLDGDRAEVNNLVHIMVNVLFVSEAGHPYQKGPGDGERWARLSISLWKRVYDLAGLPFADRHIERIESIAVMERVLAATQAIYTEMTGVRGQSDGEAPDAEAC